MDEDDELYEENLAEEYEYYDDWKDSEDRQEGISLEDYDHARCVEDYGN